MRIVFECRSDFAFEVLVGLVFGVVHDCTIAGCDAARLSNVRFARTVGEDVQWPPDVGELDAPFLSGPQVGVPPV